MSQRHACRFRNSECHTFVLRVVGARGQRAQDIQIEAKEDGARFSAMVVEEDVMGFPTIGRTQAH